MNYTIISWIELQISILSIRIFNTRRYREIYYEIENLKLDEINVDTFKCRREK